MSDVKIDPPDFPKRGEDIVQRVVTTIKRLTIKLQGIVKEQKLSGQVLNVRTGRLRRSINVEFQQDGLVGSVGTNVEYAGFHELGFQGEVKVREHLREIKMVWGRPLGEPMEIKVRAHTRDVNYPARSFLASSLAMIQPEFAEEIAGAVVDTRNRNVAP